MKPYGMTKKVRLNLPDNHCKDSKRKGRNLGNWWETEFKKIIKGAERWLGKKEIISQLSDRKGSRNEQTKITEK